MARRVSSLAGVIRLKRGAVSRSRRAVPSHGAKIREGARGVIVGGRLVPGSCHRWRVSSFVMGRGGVSRSRQGERREGATIAAGCLAGFWFLDVSSRETGAAVSIVGGGGCRDLNRETAPNRGGGAGDTSARIVPRPQVHRGTHGDVPSVAVESREC